MVFLVLNEVKWTDGIRGMRYRRFIYVELRKRLLCMQELMCKFQGAQGGGNALRRPSLFRPKENVGNNVLTYVFRNTSINILR